MKSMVSFVLFFALGFVPAQAQNQKQLIDRSGSGWRRADQPSNGWRRADQAAPAPARQVEQAQEPARPAARNRSGMLVDDLASHSARVNDLTPITIGKPVSFEEMRGYYGGFSGFGGFSMPGSQYPVYSSIQPARELPMYVQQELFKQVEKSGQFNPLLPATGQMAGHLDVVAAEAKVGNGRDRSTGRPMEIGPDNWSTARYIYVSSVGILDEQAQQRLLNGADLARLGDDFGLNKSPRWRQILWDTIGVTRQAQTDRKIVGVLHLMIVDAETRSVVKSSTGVAAVSYTELSAMRTAGYERVGVNYPGAGKFARELVQAALFSPVDEDRATDQFLNRRGAGSQKPGRPQTVRMPANRTQEVLPDDSERPVLRRR